MPDDRSGLSLSQAMRAVQALQPPMQEATPSDLVANLRLFTNNIKPGLTLLPGSQTQELPKTSPEDATSSGNDDVPIEEEGEFESEVFTSEQEWMNILSEAGDPSVAEWQVLLNGGAYKIWKYLGVSANDIILSLHQAQACAQPNELEIDLLEHQKTGIPKMKLLAQGPFGGGINGDEMGLGKTLTTLETIRQMQGEVEGVFSLIVTSRASAQQWMDEMEKYYKKGSKPRAYWLQDPTHTLNELLDQNYDFVIVTYQFLRSRYSALDDYRWYHVLCREHGVAKMKEMTLPKDRPWKDRSRVIASLHSDAYSILGLKIKFLVLDEAHMYAKKFTSLTHKAIKALHYERCFVLSGTFVPDKWWEVFGMLDFLPKPHPFDTPAKFWRAFGSSSARGRLVAPTPTKRLRLIKFLQMCVVSRPATINELPPTQLAQISFPLSYREATMDTWWSLRFLFALKLREDMKDIQVSEENSKALSHALRAQQYCGCPAAVSEDVRRLEDEILKSAGRVIELFLERIHDGDETVQQRRTSGTLHGLEREDISLLVEQLADKERLTSLLSGLRSSLFPSQRSSGERLGNESLDRSIPQLQRLEKKMAEMEQKEMQAAVERPMKRSMEAFRAELSKWPHGSVFSSKITACINHLKSLGDSFKGEKIIIFSKYLHWLDVVAEGMRRDGLVSPLRFDGSMDDRERAASRAAFSDASSKQNVILVTCGAGGAAINLASASHVILSERWWCMADVRQAIARAHRKGQTKTVHVWELEAVNSLIEPIIHAIAEKKAEVTDDIVSAVRKLDKEEPRIPVIYKYGVGDY